ncbi:hypothetical protein [Deinococcus fonticola]|uniref:hypothetical protein n=1 Tax=Deinococcus fonticola TaxID=2528713 RepID=UPI001F0F5ADD|nr:hypothetical protein [Deinococcus fonticola]
MTTPAQPHVETHFAIGLHTFVDYQPRNTLGEEASPQRRMRELLEEARLAVEVGLDVYAVGEPHPRMTWPRRPARCWQPSRPSPRTSSSAAR